MHENACMQGCCGFRLGRVQALARGRSLCTWLGRCAQVCGGNAILLQFAGRFKGDIADGEVQCS